MADVHIEVIRARGKCNAGLDVDDVFLVKDQRIVGQARGFECLPAYTTIVANLGRLKLHKGPIYLSCPDPGTGEGGNVLFRISSTES